MEIDYVSVMMKDQHCKPFFNIIYKCSIASSFLQPLSISNFSLFNVTNHVSNDSYTTCDFNEIYSLFFGIL